MPTFSAEGIIIKRSDFGESDRLLTIITPYKGKIKVLAKGVRRITSRRGGNVELLNKVKLQVYHGKSLNILTEAESIDTFSSIKNNLMIGSYASYIMELVDRLLPQEQSDPAAYNLIASILHLLEKSPRQLYIRAFEVKLLSNLGFWSLDQINASVSIRDILKNLHSMSWEEMSNIDLNEQATVELEKIMRYYIERILESPLKSLRVIQNIKK